MNNLSLLIAHQLPPAYLAPIANALPANVELIALPNQRAWEIPGEARILIAIPPRGGNVFVPDSAPPGWPNRLAWIQTASTGVDEFPAWAFEGPVVTCARDQHSEPIAEFVLASMLAWEKRFPLSWISSAEQWKSPPLGGLRGKTLGLFGFGGIGRAIAVRALAFGMHVVASKRTSQPLELEDVGLVGFDQLLAQSDHLVVAAPLTARTRGAFDAAAFAKLKPGAHFINVSRGGLVDHHALLNGLDQGTPGFASLDVTDPEPLPGGHPLYKHPRAHVSPHVSWSGGTGAGAAAFAALFLDNLQRFVEGSELKHRVSPDAGY